MKYLYTMIEEGPWKIGTSRDGIYGRDDGTLFMDTIEDRYSLDKFYSVFLPNGMRWDEANRKWENLGTRQFDFSLKYLERLAMPNVYAEAECTIDAIFLLITNLTRAEQTELYEKMYASFDHCRVYPR